MTYRNRRLLDLAHDMPCMAKFPHACTMYFGVEPAHSDSQLFGRGHGHKSHDFAFAAMCHAAHVALDEFDREAKQAEWLRAYIGTQNHLWSEGLIMVNPKRVAA
jgi:hypothetical protein